MPFTVPNATDLVAGTIRSLDQAEPDSLDFQAVGNRRNGIISGANVSSVSSGAGNPTPAYLNVILSACEVVIDGVYGSITSNLTAVIPSAPSGADTRFDVICAFNNSGTFQLDVVSGTLSATNPVFPPIPSSKIPLYAVYVKSGQNSVNPSQLLTDKRVLSLSSTVRTGTGDPAGNLGIVGDLYLDTAAQGVNTRSGLWAKVDATTWRRIAAYGELTGDVTTVGTVATIANNSVTSANIATSVAGNGLSGGGGSALAVNVDGSTIEIVSDSLRIKDGGVGTAKVVSGGTYPINVSGNAATATNAGNSGTVAGLAVHSGRNKVANQIVRTQENGYILCGYINSDDGYNENNNSSPDRVWGSNANGDSYLRAYRTSALSVNYANSAGSATSAGLANKSSTLAQNGGNGAAMTFNWSGQSGQPSWLWGSNDGTNVYVWNPSNFSVYSATQLYSGPSYGATIAHNGSYWNFAGGNSGISTNGGINAATTIYAPNVNATTCFSGNYHEFPTYNAAGSGIALIHNSSGQIRRTSSRRHLKNSISDFSSGLNILKLLRPRTFYWNVDEDDAAGDIYYKTEQLSHGFIVEEIADVFPDLVHFDVSANGHKTPIMWKQIDVVALLVKAVQELSAEVEALKAAK